VIYLSTSREPPGYHVDQTTIGSFRVLSNSTFTSHHRRAICHHKHNKVTEGSVVNQCTNRRVRLRVIRGSHSGGYEEALQSAESQQMFRTNMSPPSSGSKSKAREKHNKEGIEQCFASYRFLVRLRLQSCLFVCCPLHIGSLIDLLLKPEDGYAFLHNFS
jgi:hypothetical protein